MSDTSIPVPTPSEEIDLRAMFLTVWEHRRLILLCTLGAVAAAALYAFTLTKPIYQSTALLLPTQVATTDQLGPAAALLGKKAAGNGDVDLYQSLLTSRTVIHQLLLTPIREETPEGAGRVAPLFQVLGLDTSNAVLMEQATEGLARSISVDSKESGAGGIIEIKFSARTPWLAQQIGTAVLAIGQEELRRVRIERSAVILSRLEVAVAQAKAAWDTAARAATTYRDRNRSILLAEQGLELARLEMEKTVKEQRYLLARKEAETQQLESAKAAPPMMILDPANLPARPAKPKRPLILFLGLFLGLAGSSVGVLAWKALVVPARPR